MVKFNWGSHKVKVRKLPGFEQLGVVKLGRTWRFVDLTSGAAVVDGKEVIGPEMETYGLAAEYADAYYSRHYD